MTGCREAFGADNHRAPALPARPSGSVVMTGANVQRPSVVSRVMERFYEGLWIHGKPPARALWDAKRARSDDGAPARDWAGWVLTGDPG